MLLLTLVLTFIFQGKYDYWDIFFFLPAVFFALVLISLIGWRIFHGRITLEEFRKNGFQVEEKSNVQKADSLALVYFKTSTLTYKEYTFYYQKTIEDSLFYQSYYFYREKTNEYKAPFEFLTLSINKNFVVSGLVERKLLAKDIKAAKLLNNYFQDQVFFEKLQNSDVDTSMLSKADLLLLKNYLESSNNSDTTSR